MKRADCCNGSSAPVDTRMPGSLPATIELYCDSFEDFPGTANVLIIDDDAIHLRLCKRYLRAGDKMKFNVVSATSIRHATVAVLADTFDCIVVDCALPDGTGIEAIKLLCEILGESMPCTIVLTGESHGQSAIDALRLGASEYMCKSDLTASALCRSVSRAIEADRLQKMYMIRVKELEATNALLTKRNEEIQRFYYTASHEVKTPLTAIQEFVSILHDGIAGDIVESQKTILQYALESCEQINCQFDELLELSRFETGKMQIDLQPENIYYVFDHCIVSATPKAIAKNIDLSIKDEQDLPLVMMQSGRIIQVLSNLIGNALKFTPEHGKVTLTAHLIDEGSRLRLSVKDTGCGIPAKDIRYVFDRLYQVTPASDRENELGMGLGLSIAAQIVNLHGGNIDLESDVGKGSEFSFSLLTCDADCEEGYDRLAA